MTFATIARSETGSKQLSCRHGLTSHGTRSRPSTEPGQMLTAHRKALARCDCTLPGHTSPVSRPVTAERKAARPTPPVTARPAQQKPTESEIMAAVGAVQVPHGRIPRESWAAVEPALKLARMEFGLGQLDVRFFLAGGDDDPPRGLTHKDYPRLVWVRLDQSIPDQLEAALHEVEHLRQFKTGDRRPDAEREAAAVAFGEHWGGILRKQAYAL